MPRLTLSFYEVEHDGDLDPILSDLGACGAKVIATSINEDAELARVSIEVADLAVFRTRFKATDSFEWLN